MGYDGEMQSEKMPLPMVMQRADKADTQTMEQCAKLVGAHWNDKYGAEFARGDKFERMAAVYVDNTVRSILPIQPGQSFKPVPWGDTPIILFEAQGHPMQSLEHSRQLRVRDRLSEETTVSPPHLSDRVSSPPPSLLAAEPCPLRGPPSQPEDGRLRQPLRRRPASRPRPPVLPRRRQGRPARRRGDDQDLQGARLVRVASAQPECMCCGSDSESAGGGSLTNRV